MNSSLITLQRQAIIGERQQDERSRKARHCSFFLYGHLAAPRTLLLWLYCFLVFCRQPKWGSSQEMPSSQFALQIPLQYYLWSDLALVSFLTFNKVLKFHYSQKRKANSARLALLLLCTATLLANAFVFWLRGTDLALDMLVRPVVVTVYSRRVRRTLLIYCKIFWISKRLLGLLLGNLLLFSSLGLLLFQDYGEYPFTSFLDGAYELVVLQTTSNFPDVALPFYSRNRLSILFFVLFLVSNFMLLTNLLIAIFFKSYKECLLQRVQSIKRKVGDLYIDREMAEVRPRPPPSSRQLLLKSNLYEGVVCAACLLEFVLYIIWHRDQLYLFQQIFACVNLLLLVQNCVRVKTFREYEPAQLVELSISVVLLVVSVVALFASYELGLLKLVVVGRMIRPIRLIFREQTYRKVGQEVVRFLPVLVDQMSVLYMVALVFGFLGHALFGGLVTETEVSRIVEEGFQKQFYKYNNFNDTPSTFLLLLELIVINNWCDNVEMYSRLFGKRVRLFFIGYYGVTVLLCYNVFIASIIEHIGNHLHIERERDSD